jgi:hypothetical protein
MLAQVADFAARYASSFPKKTAAAGLTAAIRSAVAKTVRLREPSGVQPGAASGELGSARPNTSTLWTKLVAYRQIAQALKIVDHNFLLPSRKNDPAMINTANVLSKQPYR